MPMTILTPDKWENFGKDGRLFEELIGDALRIRYPEASFVSTPTTWDGGKDHEGAIQLLERGEAAIWAECKFHQDPLPIHDISMTLLMAYIEAANQVLIFSYAPIKRTFMR